MISSQLSQNLDHSKQMSHQISENYSHSITQSWNDLSSFANSHGLNETKGHNYAVSEQTSSTQAVSNLMGIVHDVAKQNRMSEHDAYQHLQGFGVSGGADISGSVGAPVGAVAGSISAKVGVNGNYSHTNSYGTSQDDGSSINVSSNEQQQFNENYNLVKNDSSTEHADQTQSHSSSQLSQISADFRQSDSIASQLNNSLSDTNRYSEMLNYAESNSGSIQNNFSQAFAEHIEKTDPTQAREILGNTDNPEIAAKREALAESFIKNNYMSQFAKNFNESRSSLTQEYQSDNSPIENNNDRVIANFVEQKNGIANYASQSGINQQSNGAGFESSVDSNLNNTKSEIGDEKQYVANENSDLSNEIKNKNLTGEKFIKNKREW